MISAIVSVDNNMGIGYQGKLVVKNPCDMAWFSGLTQGKTLVAGYNTYHSLPQLPNRNVLYDNEVWWPQGDFVIIGGEKTYKKYAPFVDELYITFNDIEAEKVDTFFPIDYYSHLTEKQVVFKGEHENMKFRVEVWKAKEKF